MSYTNSSLATFRRCPREYELRYPQRLDIIDERREALDVGTTWHAAHDSAALHGDQGYGYPAIAKHAPSTLWAVKLARLFAGYHWYWREQPLDVVESESTFRVEGIVVSTPESPLLGDQCFPVLEGRIDAKIRDESGRVGILERKTTSDSLAADSAYWDRLRLDVQVGLYAMAQPERPAFILYDVVRKPTINPKRIAKKDLARMTAELTRDGFATYYGERFGPDIFEPMADGDPTEPFDLYGARLTHDIGERPDHYFARREVHRTEDDYRALSRDLAAQVEAIEHHESSGFSPRNPEACNTFGRCAFFSLCSRNAYPKAGEEPPGGFYRREHVHPELHDDEETE